MNENPFKKIVTIILFLAFAAISCWATAESLHLLLPDWPLAAAWAVTVGFFFIASWGTKMITDSLNQNIYMEHRGLHLVGGIFIVLVFWLLCSMPTNTHTFYYRSHVRDIVTQDIGTTKVYLKQIKNKEHTSTEITNDTVKVKVEIEAKIKALEAEIMNPANPGDGPYSREILRDIANSLGTKDIRPLSSRGNSKQDREKLCVAYEEMIYPQLRTKIRSIVNEHKSKDHSDSKDAGDKLDQLIEIEKAIDGKPNKLGRPIDLNDAEDMRFVCDKINEGYGVIKNHKDFVDFNDADKKKFYDKDNPNPQTEVSRLLSVYDVWADFRAGRAGGLHFAFWVFISILIDIAAFVFFDIAFKKEV